MTTSQPSSGVSSECECGVAYRWGRSLGLLEPTLETAVVPTETAVPSRDCKQGHFRSAEDAKVEPILSGPAAVDSSEKGDSLVSFHCFARGRKG